MMSRRRKFTAHYNNGTIHERKVGELTFTAIMSTDPSRPFQVATYYNGFVEPRSISIHQSPADAIALVDERADLAEEEPGFMPGLETVR